MELTPNMAGPAFDALEKFKKDGTLPPKVIKTESKLFLPADAQAELDIKTVWVTDSPTRQRPAADRPPGRFFMT